MEHDIIYCKRTEQWVCKCGQGGRNRKSYLIHQEFVDLLENGIADEVEEEIEEAK